MGRSRAGWIAAAAALALLAAFLATCEPAADVRTPEDASEGSPGKPTNARPSRPRAGRDGGLPEGADAPSVEGPTAGADDGTGAPARPGETPREPQVTVRRISGRVVDSSNDAPVAGARVLLATFLEDPATPWFVWGSRTGPDGKFEVGPGEAESREGSRIEVIVGSPAHHLGRVAAEPDVVVRLELRRAPEQPGALTGTIVDASGAPLAGVRQLSCTDVAGDWKGLWTLAGADGSFRLDGLAPGLWRASAGEGQSFELCIVPAGGEARVTLVVARDERPHAQLTNEELRTRLAVGDVREWNPAADTEAARAARARQQSDLQALRWEELLRRPVRPVVVEGLPTDATIVRARRPGTSQWWSARPASGRAEFPALYTTDWDLEVERFGFPVTVRPVSVPAGDDALVVRWGSAD